MPAAQVLGLIFLCSEAGLAIRRRAVRSAKSQNADRGTLWLLWLVTAPSVAAGLSLGLGHLPPLLPPGVPWVSLGVVVFSLGAALRWWAISHLGRFFTVNVTLAADHRVIDTGPYRSIRHPSYTGLLLQFAGIGLALGSVPALAVVLLPPGLGLLYRIRVEEAALRGHLGDRYADYARRTWCLVPFVY